ncbi:hypothetical protein ASPCAL10035 [Aspergillus calidoustus]|uniref:F-box domain-containing protein n=1 Tax=Aspergillus calidoustus TaxID=454130 RepID=A0A0U5G560_ASPCI|nr:hypothetical protein ASPCAL10035 [Aspergillus calidoustus]
MSSLTRPPRGFPNSVLREIFTILAAAHDKHARQAQAVPMPHDSAQCVKTLAALAVASRRFSELALPVLYRTIVFSRDTHHRLLFQALRQNRSLGRLVENLTFFELRDYPAREKTAFPSLIDHNCDIVATGPLADDMQRLWGQVPSPDRKELNENVPEIRDAVLELLTVIKHLPNLKFLRYVGRASQTMFGSVLTKVINTIPAWLALPMFRDLEGIEILGCAADTWFKRIFKSFRPPRLRSLSVTYLGSPPAELGMIRLPASFSPLATIRDLRLSLPSLSPACLLPLIVGSTDLEILHLDLFSLMATGDRSHEHLWFAIRSRSQTLRELRMRFKDRYWTTAQAPDARLIPPPLSRFYSLPALELPDALLLSMQFGPQSDGWISLLPPNIQFLTVTAWFMKSDVPKRLEEVFQDAWRLPKLTRIVVRERIGQSPLIKVRLREVVERYSHRNIAYSHEWF